MGALVVFAVTALTILTGSIGADSARRFTGLGVGFVSVLAVLAALRVAVDGLAGAVFTSVVFAGALAGLTAATFVIFIVLAGAGLVPCLTDFGMGMGSSSSISRPNTSPKAESSSTCWPQAPWWFWADRCRPVPPGLWHQPAAG